MTELVSILLIDDDEEDYLITRDIVEEINHQHYTLDWVDNYQRGLEIMEQQMHDVYLIDYRLGIHSGLELLQEGLRRGVKAPMIILTGEEKMEVDLSALEAGAADYLIKNSLKPEQLERAIRYSIQQSNSLQEIRLLNQELEKRVAARTEALSMAMQRMEQTNQELEKEINERKQAEAALKDSQEELKQALLKEKDLNELKSRFVSMASHEFRTPLATILSSVNLIERYTDESQQLKREKHINRIKSNVQHLTGVLNDFLSLSKLEEGRVRYDPRKFDIREFGEELQEEMQVLTKPGQEIQLALNGPQNQVELDPALLKNILFNLLSNAIKYSPEGAPIELVIAPQPDELLISVTDHGIGIPEEEKVHVFTRFFRAKNASHIAGTGLGLNIVRQYVTLMKGTIQFKSESGKGTTFTVCFPQHTEK